MNQREYALIAELLAAHRWQIGGHTHWLLCANFANALGAQDPYRFDFERFMRVCKAHYGREEDTIPPQ